MHNSILLICKIAAGSYTKDMRKAGNNTICSVAARAGVSHSTVSRVFHRDPRITWETAEKVFAAARELGYVPEKRGTPTVGVILPIPNFDSYTSMAFAAVYREIQKRRWYCELIPSSDISMLGDRYLSGAIEILAGPNFLDEWTEHFVQPVVTFCHSDRATNNVYSVTSDGIADMERVVSYLTRFGHKKIGLLLGHSIQEEGYAENHRCSGFLIAMSKRGILSPERYALFHDQGTLEERLDTLLKYGVTAIIVLPGEFGVSLLDIIHHRGLQVPRDLSLVAWEFPNVSEFQNPPLTALLPDVDKFAATACDMLVDLWNRRKLSNVSPIPGILIERQSVSAINCAKGV
jgi:LacI family transcriptional regulator